ncbi:MAG TPA: hypothetical protein VFO31_03760 [Vicinamibacterales bacterium]|nr:hypothetical protein [Vicinamibacterales bacterium]
MPLTDRSTCWWLIGCRVLRETEPVPAARPAGAARAGAELHIGELFAIDAGYRRSSFFGSASVERRGRRLAFGVRF